MGLVGRILGRLARGCGARPRAGGVERRDRSRLALLRRVARDVAVLTLFLTLVSLAMRPFGVRALAM